MPYRSTLNSQITIDGKAFKSVVSVETDGVIKKEVEVAAAKAGTLTTRTDSDTGTLTMESGHGITTGARLDLYWNGGCRRGITVGTVATNSVPIDAGSGDDLPAATTAITAMVPHEEEFSVSGDNVKSIGAYSKLPGQIVVAESDGTEILAIELGSANGENQAYSWIDGTTTNPVAGDPIGKVFFSHANSSTPSVIGIGMGVN